MHENIAPGASTNQKNWIENQDFGWLLFPKRNLYLSSLLSKGPKLRANIEFRWGLKVWQLSRRTRLLCSRVYGCGLHTVGRYRAAFGRRCGRR